MSTWLQALGLLALLPTLGLLVYFSLEFGRQEDVQIRENLHTQSTEVVYSLEFRIRMAESVLESIAQSDAALRGDIHALYEHARRVLQLDQNFLAVVLAKPDGVMVFHTTIGFAEKTFPASHLDSIRTAIETGKSNVTGLIHTALRPDPVVAVTVPFTLKGDPNYVLRMILSSESFSKLVTDQHLPHGWVAGIADKQGTLIARNVSPGQFIGKPVSSTFLEALRLNRYTPFEAVTLEGDVGTSLVSPIHGGDWHLGLFIPNTILHAPLRDLFFKLGMLTALWLGVGPLIAEVGARFMTRQIQLVVEAVILGDDSKQVPKPIRILELQQIFRRFKETKKQLAQLSSHLDIAQSERNDAYDLYDHAPCGYHSLDREGRIIKINQTELDWLGYRREELLGQPITKLFNSSSRDIFKTHFPRLLSQGMLEDFELEMVHKNGSTLTMLVQVSSILDEEGHFLSSRTTTVDISARKRFEAKLELEAHSDALTGLKNRRDFDDHAEHEIARSLRQDSPLSILMLDIDHFKRVNDSYGHSTGDGVLRQLGAGLREVLRETDIPARIGGEEFAVLMPDTDLDTAAEVAQRVRAWVATQPFQTADGGAPIAVTVSLGVAQMRAVSASIGSLMKDADDALYLAKREGRNQVRRATPQ